jgi:hypothetical protein
MYFKRFPTEKARHLTPTQQYSIEFHTACGLTADRTGKPSPHLPGIRGDCVDWAIVGPILETFLSQCSDDDLILRGVDVSKSLLLALSAACGFRFALTLGWFELSPLLIGQLVEEGRYDAMIADMLESGARYKTKHAWLTSAGFEIIDIVLPTLLNRASGKADAPRPIFYFSNQDTELSIIYHPTLVEFDWSDK